MDRYRCSVCGYIYGSAVGDGFGNIASGTLFEKLSRDWVRPGCRAAKSEFEKID